MIGRGAAALLLAAVGAPHADVGYSQVIVQGQVTVRVRAFSVEPPPRYEWRERKGPKCISADEIAGAAVMDASTVDIILRDNRRIRAKLESSCPALDFYRGFYLKPAADRMICADRDVIRSRMGGQCGIDRFRLLKPVRRD